MAYFLSGAPSFHFYLLSYSLLINVVDLLVEHLDDPTHRLAVRDRPSAQQRRQGGRRVCGGCCGMRPPHLGTVSRHSHWDRNPRARGAVAAVGLAGGVRNGSPEPDPMGGGQHPTAYKCPVESENERSVNRRGR